VSRPNVILVVFDTARADVFEPYGAPAGASACVADLARRGTHFPNAIATGSWTVPSHASMFTGALPMSIGTDGARGTPKQVHATMGSVADRILPAVLRRNGYDTAAVSTNLWVSSHTGFDTGFDRFEYLGSTRVREGHAQGLKSRMIWDLQALRANLDDGAEATERVLDGWLRQRSAKPFFWFVNLIECHSPYLPPKPYNDLGAIQRLKAGEDARKYQTMASLWLSCLGGGDIPDSALDRMRHLYARSILALDDWLARLLANLDRHGLLDETIVIVTSDHGENFGEGGLRGHSFSLDHRLIKVPLVVAGPGAVNGGAPSMFSLADLPALIAQWTAVDDHPWEPYAPRDVAVSQFQAPSRIGDDRVEQSVKDWHLDEEAVARLTCDVATATYGNLKLRRRAGVELLFDLDADPLELAGRPPGSEDDARAVDAMRAALDASEATSVVGRSAEAVSSNAEAGDEDAELEAQMKLLGYL
jgi:arylsulfatase A-like enzyme